MIAFRWVPMPMVTVQIEYLETRLKLAADKLLWMVGDAPHINTVLLVKWI